MLNFNFANRLLYNKIIYKYDGILIFVVVKYKNSYMLLSLKYSSIEQYLLSRCTNNFSFYLKVLLYYLFNEP